ncbi:hypothetical protein [Clostridium fungisolvens]|uniref:Uncharacterized protein n=1 Tax=Clostridium fungisolvens TaxID=1604897 RepID=A0A6V8SG71_9CLOT|nr:hypothetical protein [Clostridium fungisolvens]GFP75475.1 hypothetical protein bsdtw1_01555 [Clostridium fungisolvens]
MIKVLKKHFYLPIFPIFLVIGLLRKYQLDTTEKIRFGYVHGSGSQTLIVFISISIFLTAISMFLQRLFESGYTKAVKIRVTIAISVISICMIFILFSVVR